MPDLPVDVTEQGMAPNPLVDMEKLREVRRLIAAMRAIGVKRAEYGLSGSPPPTHVASIEPEG